MMLHSIPTGQLFGSSVPGEQIEVSVNGERVALIDINPRMSEADPNGMNLVTPKIYVKAGPQRVSAAFVSRFDAPVDDLLAPIEQTMADSQIGSGFGITALPHLREFAITGPIKVTGVSDTPSRRRIFTLPPDAAAEEAACAASIIKRSPTQAYRGPVTARRRAEADEVLRAGPQARRLRRRRPHGAAGDAGEPASSCSASRKCRRRCAPGQNYRITDLDLASRLSFFIWGTGPDAGTAEGGAAGHAAAAARCSRSRSSGCWPTAGPKRWPPGSPRSGCACRTWSSSLRTQLLYPQYDRTLADALKRETELLLRQPSSARIGRSRNC